MDKKERDSVARGIVGLAMNLVWILGVGMIFAIIYESDLAWPLSIAVILTPAVAVALTICGARRGSL